MSKHLIGLALASVVIMGAGCAPAATPEPTAGNNTTPTPVEDTTPAVKGPVKFSTLKNNILDAQKEYSEFRFENGTGSCVDKGLPNPISYKDDATLGYFAMESADRSYVEDMTMADALNTIRFKDVPLVTSAAGAEPVTDLVDCKLSIPYGTDTATVTCSMETEEVCTATYEAVAIAK